MKSLKTTISITELQKTIKIWRSRKITDSTIPKLLDLYLGLTAYMNDKHIYPVENFYDIKMSLRFSTTQSLIEAVKASQSFKFIVNEGQKQIKAFYSPLCHEENSKLETKEDSKTSQSSLNLPQAFAQTLAVDNIYNIYTIQDNKNNTSSGRISSAEKSLETARNFFHLINKNRVDKMRILTPLIDSFQQKEGLAREDACANVVYLVNELLVPYFASQERFMKSTHVGRLCWLNNLLKSAGGLRMLKDAADAGRRKRLQYIADMRGEQRNNHPLSEFEWTDKESGLRFYDDPLEGMVNIPDDAPPRPGAKAEWNVLSGEWGEL